MKLRTLVITLLFLAGGLASSSAATADPGCDAGEACVRRGPYSGTNTYAYDFARADPNLSNNHYDDDRWPFYGPTVNDNVRAARNRNSAWSSACVYRDTYHRHLIGGAPYNGVTWVAVNQGASSIAMWRDFVC